MQTKELTAKENGAETKEVGQVRNSELGIFQNSMADFSNEADMPEVDNTEAYEVEHTSEYWSPEEFASKPGKRGESRTGVYAGITLQTRLDTATGEETELPTATFYAKKDGSVFSFSNASKRLVGAMETVPIGAVVVITYMGKKDNKKNEYKSDTWSIKPAKVSK